MTHMTQRMMTVGVLTIVAGITVISIADAQSRRGRAREGLTAPRMEMRQQVAEKLNLSDAQKEKLAAIHEDTRRQEILLHGKMADLQAQIRVEFMNDNLDKDKIRALHREMSALRAAAADARIEVRLAASDVLTPEQREQMKEMRLAGPRRGMSCPPGCGMGHGGGCGMGRWFGAGLGPQADDQAPMMGMGFPDGDLQELVPMGPGPSWMDDDDAPTPPAPPAPPSGEE